MSGHFGPKPFFAVCETSWPNAGLVPHKKALHILDHTKTEDKYQCATFMSQEIEKRPSTKFAIYKFTWGLIPEFVEGDKLFN